MNRAQRRAAAKAQPRYVRMLTPEQRKAALVKNGITPEDVQKEHDDGWHEGFNDAGRETIRTVYAQVVRQLGRRGWKPKSIIQFMRAVDQGILESLASSEDIEAALAETGIALDFADPFDRVQEAGE